MTSPVRRLMQAGRLDRFLIGGQWVAPEGTDRISVQYWVALAQRYFEPRNPRNP
ncbi:hypothetical protein B0G75_12550 [Paraburkholderia sp. BL18I3N2]|nr:hypothetical protein B0G75_12550 [Paraburkholderia sp. BL18I3N2]